MIETFRKSEGNHVKIRGWLIVICLCVVFAKTISIQAAAKLPTPTLVSATASGTNKITIKWKKVSGASGYRVYRRTDSDGWITVKTISGNTKWSYLDTNLSAGTKYYYKVRAYQKKGQTTSWSAFNKEPISAITGLTTPALVSAKHLNKNTVQVKWKKVVNAKGYVIYRKNENSWKKVAVVRSGNTVIWNDTGASSGKNVYTVRAYTVFENSYKYSSYVSTGITSDIYKAGAVVPTVTPMPTLTPIPTVTPIPTATPTAVPEPTITPIPDTKPILQTKWDGKTALVIGDSQSVVEKWQLKLVEILGLKFQTHAMGGMTLLQCMDGNGAEFAPLSLEDVAGKDLVILYAGYNNANSSFVGNVGDCYPQQDTVAGQTQYAINRIREYIAITNNEKCEIVIITPHCAGRNPYMNFGGEEKNGSYASYKETADIMECVANANGIPCYNAYRNSGINESNYSVYARNTYYPDAPYPNVPDCLHLSDTGYFYLGTKISEWLANIQ